MSLIGDLHRVMLLGSGLVGLLLVVRVVRAKPGVGWLAVGTFIAIASDVPVTSPVVNIGGIAVYPEDIAITVLLLATLPDLRKVSTALGTRAGLWVVVIGFASLSLWRGATDLVSRVVSC